MDMKTIFGKFDQIGCLTFATIEKDTPQTRIAHLFAYDDEGLYFRTMTVKPFYRQLKETGKVSVCGMYPETRVFHDENGMPRFKPGYTIRATGDVREISLTLLKEKAAVRGIFMMGVKDIERYPAMTTFCLYRAWGEVYDFDYEMEHRPHKLLRTGFSFGGARIPFRGMRITEKCISCGECRDRCTFKAISERGDRFVVDHSKCDACGDCYTVCPAGAVEFIAGDPVE